jgi:hypothetical protein
MMAALPAIRDEVARLTAPSPSEDEALGTLRPLLDYQSKRGQAVLYLTTSGMHWDAEIVLRAYFEASARILFIALTAPEARKARIDEFWDVLGGIGERRRAVKADEARGVFKNDPRSAAIMDVFRDPRLFNTEPKANKATRKATEQKWSFVEIVAELTRNSHAEIGGLLELAGYLHPYGMASHLLHVDPVALDLMHDEATRPASEEILLTAAHIARIFTDVVGLSYFCADAIRVMLKAEFNDAAKVQALVVRCIELSNPVLEMFYDSQAEFYSRHGRAEFEASS